MEAEDFEAAADLSAGLNAAGRDAGAAAEAARDAEASCESASRQRVEARAVRETLVELTPAKWQCVSYPWVHVHAHFLFFGIMDHCSKSRCIQRQCACHLQAAAQQALAWERAAQALQELAQGQRAAADAVVERAKQARFITPCHSPLATTAPQYL